MYGLMNFLLRRAMRSALRFDAAPGASAPSDDVRAATMLYVHIPFCESLCPYCSFHRYVYEPQLAEGYYDALLRELQLYHDRGCRFTAMYIGGGTPTICMDRLCALIDRGRSLYPLREISVETNPNHLHGPALRRLHRAGVRRLSVGVQSFNDDLLRRLGRYEKYGDSAAIRHRLRQALGIFETLNIDLHFNLPQQTRQHLLHDLRVVEELLPDQVTFYPLMASPSVARALQRLFGPVDYGAEREHYATILAAMRGRYTGSTAWCFSRRASMIDEYIIAHDRYVGAGSGAFGYHSGGIFINTFSLAEYRQRLQEGVLPIALVKQFSRRETLRYVLLMKLFGLSLTRAELERLRATHSRFALAPELWALRVLGAVRTVQDGFTLSDRGKYFWVMAMREFFIAVDALRDRCRDAVADAAAGCSEGRGDVKNP